MEIIIKFFDKTSDTLPKVQIENYWTLEIDEDLTSFSSCNLTIPIIEWIEALDIVRIYEIQDTDVLLFEWYIDTLEPWINEISLTIKDYKAFLQRKWLIQDVTYTTQTVKQIIDDMISYYNALWDNWVCISSISDTLTKDYSMGDNIYDILNELAIELQAQWIIYWTTIYFAPLVWDDLTSWVNFTEIIYNWIDPSENNINSISLSSYWNIENIIVWIDSNDNKTVKTDSTSIALYWPLFWTINTRSWDLETFTQTYLDFKKVPQNIYKLEIEPFTIDVNIWDKVAVRIEETNSYLNYEGSAYIITKNTKIENATKVITYGVSTYNVKIIDFLNTMREIESAINYLSI